MPVVSANYGDISITILLKLFLLFILPVAQANDAIVLENNTPIIINLDETSPIILAYSAQRGDIINLTARAIDDVDVVLEVLDAQDTRIAFNDNHHTDNNEISASDAVIENLSLNEAGVYLVRVDSFNGVSVGDVEITLENEPAFEIISDDDNQRILQVDLHQNEIFIYKLEPESNELITVTIEASGITDTVLQLFDDNQMLIAENDDYIGDEVFISSLASRIENASMQAGQTYALHITEFLGRPATITVIIDRQNAE